MIDGVLSGLYLLCALVLGTSSPSPSLAGALACAGLAIGGTAAIVLRRRFAVRSYAGAAVLALLSTAFAAGAELIPLLVTLYAVGAYRSARAAWLCFVGALTLAAAAAYVITVRSRSGLLFFEPTQPPISGDPVSDWLNAALIFALLALIVTLMGTGAGQHRRYVAALVGRAAQLARERDARAEIATAAERERIAREMHDVIAHSVSVMIALAEGAHAAASEHPEVSQDAIARVAETGRRTLHEVRRMLRPADASANPDRTPQPGAAQLPDLAEQLRQAGLPVQLTVMGTPPEAPALGLTVYRIVQESLTNALRHARGATEVVARVTWQPNEVAVLVEDDAPAAVLTSELGRGIRGIRERAALYDGLVEAGPRPDGGWRVFVRLKWTDV